MATTQSTLEQVYNDSILAENPNLSPALQQGQDLYFKRKAVTQICSIVSQEQQQISNNIFPASSSSTALYLHVSALGLPVTTGATPSSGTIILTDSAGSINPPVTFTIPTGTVLTSVSGVQYFVLTTITLLNGIAYEDQPVEVQSVLSGANTFATPNSQLTFISTITIPTTSIKISNGTIKYMTSGSDAPTDIDTANVINDYMQNQDGGGNESDYIKWALASSPSITNAKIIAVGAISSNNNAILIAVMAGSSDPYVNIGISYPISRRVINSIIQSCTTYINTYRPVNDNPFAISVDTFNISKTTLNYITSSGNLNCAIDLSVKLADGLDVTTFVTGTDGSSRTVSDWIKRQFRFAVLSAPYGGVNYGGAGKQVLLGENITTILTNTLGNGQYLTGTLASILVSATFTYTDVNVSNQSNIPVPNATQAYITDGTSNIRYFIIYDIDPTIINIIPVS